MIQSITKIHYCLHSQTSGGGSKTDKTGGSGGGRETMTWKEIGKGADEISKKAQEVIKTPLWKK